MITSPTVQARHDELIAQGQEALLAGNKAQAQALLNAAVNLDPRSEEAWLWLSGTHTAPDAMAHCLHQVLAINPHNQQALDGLQWLSARHASAEPPMEATHDAGAQPVAIAFHTLRPAHHTIGLLLEAALHPLAVGVLLGLLRLVAWLRPATLVLLRSDGGPLGLGGSLGVVLLAALTHGLALGGVWLALGLQLSQLRINGRGDRFDSLVRAGQLWTPGYLAAGALLAATAGLGLSPGPWRIVAGVCWLLVLLAAGLIMRRLWMLLDQLAVPEENRLRQGGRLAFTLLLGLVLGLGAAGIITAAVLG